MQVLTDEFAGHVTCLHLQGNNPPLKDCYGAKALEQIKAYQIPVFEGCSISTKSGHVKYPSNSSPSVRTYSYSRNYSWIRSTDFSGINQFDGLWV